MWVAAHIPRNYDVEGHRKCSTRKIYNSDKVQGHDGWILIKFFFQSKHKNKAISILLTEQDCSILLRTYYNMPK